METVEDLCDDILLINKSKKILEGTKKQVKAQFKTNTFTVEHRGAFALNDGLYELIRQEKTEEDFHHSLVKMKAVGSPNQLIHHLTLVTEIFSFSERVPTMSEIFITLVKGESNE